MTVDDKIKQIRTMARKIEACMYASSNGDLLVDRIKSQIMDMETRHRRGVEFGRYRSKPIAVEVLTVAGKGKRLRKTLPIRKMFVREDYLTARQLVAQEFAILFDRKKGIKRPELMRVAEMCDYTDIVTTK